MTYREILESLSSAAIDAEGTPVSNSFPPPIGLSADIFVGKVQVR